MDGTTAREQASERGSGGPTIEKYGVAIFNMGERRLGDCLFLLTPAFAPFVQRGLGFMRTDGSSAAVGAQDAPVVGERAQVSPHGRFGHAEVFAQRTDIVHAAEYRIEHRLTALVDFHVSESSR